MRRRTVLACAAVGVVVLLLFVGVASADFGVSAVEGQSFTGDVAAIGGCNLAGAEITWGDGTAPSPGTLDGDRIQGTHTYAEEGTFNGSVSYTCTNFAGVQAASFTATVQDASLGAAGRDVSGSASQSITGVIAHITDANPGATADDFSAQITWGDGSSSAGTIAAAPGGGFDVSGTHTYNAGGSYTVRTSIADTGGSTASASSTAQIAGAGQPPPALHARLGLTPSNPCRDDSIRFDASASGGGSPIAEYHWSFANVTRPLTPRARSSVETAVTTTPLLTRAFGAFARSNGKPDHRFDEFGPNAPVVYDFRVLRPPITVSLTVIDSAGRTASTSQTVAFLNPDEVIAYDLSGPDRWTASSNVPACQNRLDTAASFGAAFTQDVSLAETSVGLQIRCPNPLLNCVDVLDIRSAAVDRRAHGTAARRRGSDASLLGRAAFIIPAGQTIKVTVKLNARGRALARAHKLHMVTLQLSSPRAKGKVVTTIRTVRLRVRRSK